MKLITKLTLSAILLVGSLSFALPPDFNFPKSWEPQIISTCRELEGENLEKFQNLPIEHITEYLKFMNDETAFVTSEVEDSAMSAVKILFPIFNAWTYKMIVGSSCLPNPDTPEINKQRHCRPSEFVKRNTEILLLKFAVMCLK